MATKTFEELKQLAIQIRDEKTNKQNTATRIGTQMLEHLDKLEQDYYDKTTINNRTSEYNVSINHPTSGISGGNKYDLTSAIGQVPAELRTAGVKVSFLNESGNVESWEFSGGSWAVGGFEQVGAERLSELSTDLTNSSFNIQKNFVKQTSSSKYDFAVSDEEGNNVFVINKGHVKTKNFDSEKVAYEDLSKHDFALSDEEGNNVLVINKGHIRTKKFDSSKLDDKFKNIESLIADISGTVLSNSVELSVTWDKGVYLREDGNVETTIVEGGQVSDFISYTPGMAIIGGFVKQAQNYILACLYDNNNNKIGAIYATKDVQEDGTNMECWQYLTASQDNLDEGYNLDDIKFIKFQSNSNYNPKVYTLTGFDRLVNGTFYLKNKKIAFLGGSYSSINYGVCFKAYLRLKFETFVRTFGVGGAGFGINSCWPKGYPNPELQDGKVVWEDSVPKQIDKAIQYCIDNDITDGFDYWILWASTNDFNTHIKGKGEVDYTLDQLQDTTQFGNADTQDGGIILSINKIRQAYPKAKILFFGSLPFFSEKYGYNLDDTTKPSANVWLENGNREQKTQINTFKEFIADQKAICEKYHIPYLDQMGLANIDEWNYEEFYNPEDGYLHPLRQGFLRWINFQINFIINN